MKIIFRDRKFGVTLFELLVVVLVTSILTSIFVLSSRRVLVTSKISRVKEEHAVLTQAISHYQVDFNVVPPNGVGLQVLKEPTKYLSNIPFDPFISPIKKEYIYFSNPSTKVKYIIVSAGPDGDIDMLPFMKQVAQQPYIDTEIQDRAFGTLIENFNYDPTNGINSNGDLITIVPAN